MTWVQWLSIYMCEWDLYALNRINCLKFKTRDKNAYKL